MEIVIESDPYRPSSASPGPTYLRSPVAGQPHISTNSAFYYATLPRGVVGTAAAATTAAGRLLSPGPPVVVDAPDGAPTTSAVRRVDKSGLLEIADVEPVGARSHAAAATACGTLSRRLDRSGLLEAVPEVPDQQQPQQHHHQCHRTGLASDELLAAAATTRSMVERQQHLLGAETDGFLEAALLRRRAFAASAAANSNSAATVASQSESGESSCPLPPPPPVCRSGPRVKFADESLDEIKEAPASCRSSRLSPRLRQASLSHRIPDVIEAHNSNPAASSSSATTAADASTATSTSGSSPSAEAPEGERAEAEGCEHTVIEAESRLATQKSSSAGAGAKIGHNHNDNIQAVHVIILSEQL